VNGPIGLRRPDAGSIVVSSTRVNAPANRECPPKFCRRIYRANEFAPGGRTADRQPTPTKPRLRRACPEPEKGRLCV